jgi:iturin family lipopeptide synthetase C
MSTESTLDLQALAANKNVKAREYWQNRLGGFAFNTYFESYAAAPLVPRNHTRYTVTAPAETAEGLNAIARTDKAKHIVLLAALGILAQKCSSIPDVCIFSPLYASPEDTGGTAPWLPIRINDFSGCSFPEFVVAVKDLLVQDFKHGDYPLAKILGACDKPEPLMAIGALVEEIHPTAVPDALSPAALFSFRVTGGLSLTIAFDANQFDQAYVEQIGKLYFCLLGTLMGNRTLPVRAISLVPAEERDMIMHAFNRTEKAFPHHQTVLDLFAVQVSAHPDRVAVRFEGQQLTYAQLNARSNQVAHYLSAQLPGGAVVGVQLDRSPELIVALFGILKAGCVYLPLTNDYPEARVKYVLGNSNAKMLLTNRVYPADVLGEGACVDPRQWMSYPTTDMNRARPGDTAYIIYTSGSTGMPKGVPIRHRSVVNRLNWMQNQYPLTQHDAILQKTPVVFDVSVWELFWWAMYGARLVLAAPGAEKDPAALCRVIEQEHITVLHFVPPMLNALLGYLQQNGRQHVFSSLRHVFASGEELKPADAQLWLRYCPHTALHNLYGPTEATIDVSFYQVSGSAQYHRIPIGKPIDNTTLYILNQEQQLQPILIPGELCIGGENLSDGYLNRPELTRERFIPNPLRADTMLYRTGDLARWLPDGNIEYLGRIDDQVKIRGNRVEPAEIEQVLKTYEGVSNAVVLTRQVPTGLQLIAFVMSNPAYQEEALRAYLSHRLPEYMIPSVLVPITEVPVNTNGKVDRKKLLAMESPAAGAYVPPATPAEKALAAQWERVLRNKKVGLKDNFFRIGGDSILGVRLIGAVNNEWSARLSMADLFEHPTLEALAQYLERTEFSNVGAGYQPVLDGLASFSADYLSRHANDAIEAVYPMSDIEKGMCFVDRANPQDLLYFEQNVSNILYENFSVPIVQKALDLLVEKHEALRTGFDLDEYVHIVYKKLDSRVQYRDLSGMPPTEREAALQAELVASRQAHFDLSAVPLWRVRLFKMSSSYHVLAFETHHAVFDGWSYSAFITELNNVYGMLLRNPSLRLSKLACSYKDFIVEELYHKDNQETIDYWKTTLKGYKKLEFNTRSTAKVFRSEKRNHPFGLVEQLRKVAGQRDTTVKNLLLAAHLYTLKVLTGESDILIGLATFNRPLKQDGEKLLGCFLNTIPFRVCIPDKLTWREYGALVDQKVLEVKKHEHLSLIQIKEAVGQRTYHENPFYDTLFNFINFHVLEDIRPEATSAPAEGTLALNNFLRGHTLFDVNLHVNDSGIHAMYELVEPLMDQEHFDIYLRIFNSLLPQLLGFPDQTIDPYHLFWRPQIEQITGAVAGYRPDPAAAEELVPASCQQEWQWQTNQRLAGPVFSNAFLVMDIEGDLRPEWLAQSLEAVLSKHDALRTQLTVVDGKLFQRVQPSGPVALHVQDVQGKSVAEWISAVVDPPFAFDQQLLRYTLLRTSASTYKLVLVMQPGTDRYSVHRLAHCIWAHYCSGAAGAATAEAEIPLQYAGFSRWQRECLPQLDACLRSYWRKQLSGPLQPVRLPARRPDPDVYAYRRAAVAVRLPDGLARQIQDYQQQQALPTHLILLAGFKLLLHKYTRQETMVVVTGVDNREQESLRTLVGPVANLVAVKSTVTPADCFAGYLAGLSATWAQALRYQAMPFGRLEQELAPTHDGHQMGLFNVQFQYWDDAPPSLAGTADASARLGETGYADSPAELSLFLTRDQAQIRGSLRYNAHCYGQEDMLLLLEHYYRLLEQVLTDPSACFSTVEMFSEQEQQQALRAFDRTGVPYPEDKTLVDLFNEQARRTPDQVALVFEDTRLTYRQVDQLSNHLALVLSQRGVQADQIVGLLMDRSVETVVGMLAILKAGGAYLPIDVDYPQERIHYLISDSGTRLIVTRNRFAGAVPAGVPCIFLEEVLPVSGPGGPDPEGRLSPPAVPRPGDLCYVIYTSGTTGNPKGVMVEHRNVVQLLFNEQFQFSFSHTDVWTMFHSHCFDFSVWEMYGALLLGGRLVIVPKMVARDSSAYLDLLVQEGVTVINQTPSAFYQLLREEVARPAPLLQLRYVLVGGEALSPGRLKTWASRYPTTKLVNVFGITETTVFVTNKEIGEAEIARNVSNIGKPIPAYSVYLLDADCKPVPKGVVGELYVGGAGVTRGYLGKPELTRQKFVPNPFNPAETLYRSGDLARVTADGDLEYLGRMDHQVQLRGFRIELAEVESKLLAYEGIKDAVVVGAGKEEDAYLVGYYVAAAEVEAGALRQFLATKLPDYMVPSYFVHLDSLPLTDNGKTDLHALPPPRIRAVAATSVPVTQLQQQLVNIWAEVLQLDEAAIGVQTNFFDAGGNSVKLMQMVSKVNKQLGCRLTVGQIFALPVIEAIAAFVATPPAPDSNPGQLQQEVEQMSATVDLLAQLGR